MELLIKDTLLTTRDTFLFHYVNDLSTKDTPLKDNFQMVSVIERFQCISTVCLLVLILFISNGTPHSSVHNETRVWKKFENDWKCVHFHRSQPSQ